MTRSRAAMVGFSNRLGKQAPLGAKGGKRTRSRDCPGKPVCFAGELKTAYQRHGCLGRAYCKILFMSMIRLRKTVPYTEDSTISHSQKARNDADYEADDVGRRFNQQRSTKRHVWALSGIAGLQLTALAPVANEMGGSFAKAVPIAGTFLNTVSTLRDLSLVVTDSAKGARPATAYGGSSSTSTASQKQSSSARAASYMSY